MQIGENKGDTEGMRVHKFTCIRKHTFLKIFLEAPGFDQNKFQVSFLFFGSTIRFVEYCKQLR